MAHADKRTVATDALETLGTVFASNEKRDAIHLAVEPITPLDGEVLYPGQHIGVVYVGDGTARASAAPHVKKIGIVDPFLASAVYPGQKFWLVIYPRVINSLRHVWTHPDLADEVVSVDRPFR